jgi:hypothetical protein
MSKSIQDYIEGFVYLCHSEINGFGWTPWHAGKVSEPCKIGLIRGYTEKKIKYRILSPNNTLWEVSKRISTLQIGNPNNLEIRIISGLSDDVYNLENYIQKKYKKYHIRGEWYNLSSKQVQNIGKLMETLTEERNHYNLHKVLL